MVVVVVAVVVVAVVLAVRVVSVQSRRARRTFPPADQKWLRYAPCWRPSGVVTECDHTSISTPAVSTQSDIAPPMVLGNP